MTRKPELETMKKRAGFLAVAANGKKWVTPGLILQIKKHAASDDKAPGRRYGLTASRKVGGAVQRNRARRRLRALAREVLAERAAPSYDYVLIARPATVTRGFPELRNDLVTALKRLNVWQELAS